MANGFDFKVVDRDLGFKALERRLGGKPLHGKAGVIGAKGAAEHEAEHGAAANDEPLTNAELALVHEFGTDKVPERSFIRAAFDANHERYFANMKKLVGAVIDKKLTLRRAIGLVSSQMASDMRGLIRSGAGIPPPNAPATVERKGSSRPLVDSGQLLGSISHAVVTDEVVVADEEE